MLKLEKKSRSDSITISLRNKGSAINPIFLKAFLIALAFHLVGLLIFHIKPFKLIYTKSVLSPIEVNIIKESTLNQEISFHLDDELLNPGIIPEPPFIEPILPKINMSEFSHQIAYPKILHHTLNIDETFIKEAINSND